MKQRRVELKKKLEKLLAERELLFKNRSEAILTNVSSKEFTSNINIITQDINLVKMKLQNLNKGCPELGFADNIGYMPRNFV